MGLESFTPSSAKDLEAIPDQKSTVPAGQYVVKYTQEATASAADDEIQSTLWFKTPELSLQTIRRITEVRLFAESRDQGDGTQANWTWFELGIFENEAATEPLSENNVQFVEFYDGNNSEGKDYRWLNGRRFQRRKGNLLNLLKERNTIGVRICARFQGWAIWAKTGYLVLDISEEITETKPVPMKEMEQLAYEIQRIDNTLQEVIESTEGLSRTTLPGTIYQVGEIDRGRGEKPLRVLCLDGGGVRGLASLHLLKAWMERYNAWMEKDIERQEPDRRPCQVFDMIGGTSTGGLIAIMLGCLKMTLDECIQVYTDTMGTVFRKRWWSNGKLLVDGAKYSADALVDATRTLIANKRDDGNGDAELLDDKNLCKVFVMAVDSQAPNKSAPIILRSYSNSRVQPEFPNITMWQAARATSAAPSYFEALQINGRSLVDGGLSANNPLGWMWTEIVNVYGPAQRTECFLSIGTCIPARVPLPANMALHPVASMSALASIATNTEIVHLLFTTLIDVLAPEVGRVKYCRMNISREIMKVVQNYIFPGETEVEVKLDDSDQAARVAMINAAKDYIGTHGVEIDRFIQKVF